jgi:hypothetical protein
MASNRGVVFLGPNHVEVQSIDFPKLANPAGKKVNHGVIPIAKIVNATVITLDKALQGYKNFDKGAAKKFVIDPHNLLKAAA